MRARLYGVRGVPGVALRQVAFGGQDGCPLGARVSCTINATRITKIVTPAMKRRVAVRGFTL
jgi:hypothetical protein